MSELEPSGNGEISINVLLDRAVDISPSLLEDAGGELLAWRSVGITHREVIQDYLDHTEQVDAFQVAAYLRETDEYGDVEKARILAPLFRNHALNISGVREYLDEERSSQFVQDFTTSYWKHYMQVANFLQEFADVYGQPTE